MSVDKVNKKKKGKKERQTWGFGRCPASRINPIRRDYGLVLVPKYSAFTFVMMTIIFPAAALLGPPRVIQLGRDEAHHSAASTTRLFVANEVLSSRVLFITFTRAHSALPFVCGAEIKRSKFYVFFFKGKLNVRQLVVLVFSAFRWDR